MPSFTIGSTFAAVLQFVVIVGVLIPMLITHTDLGGGVLPVNTINHLNGTMNMTNQSYIATSGQNSLRVQMGTAYNQSANNATAGSLQQLGGLAFIPSAWGKLMSVFYNMPGTVNTLITSLLNFQSPYVIFPFSVFVISAALMGYMTFMFILKGLTAITKVELEDV